MDEIDDALAADYWEEVRSDFPNLSEIVEIVSGELGGTRAHRFVTGLRSIVDAASDGHSVVVVDTETGAVNGTPSAYEVELDAEARFLPALEGREAPDGLEPLVRFLPVSDHVEKSVWVVF